MNKIEELFEQSFKELLGNRTGIESVMDFGDKFNDGKIHIESSKYTTMPDYGDEYEYTQEDEIPGYYVFINPTNIDNYTYLFLKITLPTKNSSVVEVIVKGLNGQKKHYLSDANELEKFISDMKNLKEYKSIIKRLESI